MSWETEFDNWTAEYLPDLRILCNEPMSRHTSFRIGGPAKRMALPERRSSWCCCWIMHLPVVRGL